MARLETPQLSRGVKKASNALARTRQVEAVLRGNMREMLGSGFPEPGQVL
jgi:hypothetical protein